MKPGLLDRIYGVGGKQGGSLLRGCPETSQPRCEAFKPLFGDIGKQDKIAAKAC
jgi:hypothetical protein